MAIPTNIPIRLPHGILFQHALRLNQLTPRNRP
jgi:hypothetical protein